MIPQKIDALIISENKLDLSSLKPLVNRETDTEVYIMVYDMEDIPCKEVKKYLKLHDNPEHAISFFLKIHSTNARS